MRQTIVMGNWKMNGLTEKVKSLISDVSRETNSTSTNVVVIPPYPYLALVRSLLVNTPICLGAQSVSEFQQGAYTGEISADMLADVGCQYVLVGHSERRQLFAEDNATVARKFKQAVEYGLTPVLCIGETLEAREQNKTIQIVVSQIQAVIDLCGIEALNQSVIAYEPVWAIGTGKTATPEQAQAVHQAIRGWLTEKNLEIGQQIRILYGGSVNGSNAQSIFSMPDVDGGLIGGASLKAHEFVTICHSFDTTD